MTIYYTIDGSNPKDSITRRLYIEPIPIETYTVLNYIAVDSSNNWGKNGSVVFNITDGVVIEGLVINLTIIAEFQKILDEAVEGSKIIFTENIVGANFTINKALNLVTTNVTLIGNGIDPVFTINADNVTINGFTINQSSSGDGIFVNHTNNATINNCRITCNGTGINIVNSTNTNIKDSILTNCINGVIINCSEGAFLKRVNITDSEDNAIWVHNSKNTTIVNSTFLNNGKNQFTSVANTILVDASENTYIWNNNIKGGFFAIHLINTNVNANIYYNTFRDITADTILLEGRYGANLTQNLIDGAFIGINFNGYSEKVIVTQNVVMNIRNYAGEPNTLAEYNYVYNPDPQSDLYGQCYNCVQISAGSSNFAKGVYMENNIFIKNKHRSFEGRHTGDYNNSCFGFGYNLWDGSSSYQNSTGAMTFREGYVDLVIDRVGDSSYRLRLINERTGEYLSGLRDFPVIFSAGSYTQTVIFHDSEAVATFDVSTTITKIKARISNQIYKFESWDIPITEGYNNTNKASDAGYSDGEAINNQNPVVPDIPQDIPTPDKPYGGDNNNDGEGTGKGTGTGGGVDDTGTAGKSDSLNPGSEGDGDTNYNNPSASNPTNSKGTSETVISIPDYDSELIINNTNKETEDNKDKENNNTNPENNDKNNQENNNTNQENTNNQENNNNNNTDSNLVKAVDGTADAPSSSSSTTAGTTSIEAIAQSVVSAISSIAEAGESSDDTAKGLDDGAKGSDDTAEGGESAGDTSKSYEIKKSIDKKSDNVLGYVISIIVLIIAIGLGIFGYKKRRDRLE